MRTTFPSPVTGLAESETQAATAVNLGVWGAVALWSAVSTWVSARAAGGELGLWSFVVYFVPGWMLWTLVTWAIFRIVRRPTADRRDRFEKALRLALLGIVWTVLYSLSLAAFEALLRGWSPSAFRRLLLVRFNLWAYIDLVIFGCLTVAIYGVSYYLRYQEERRSAAELRERLAQGELKALRAQLQPHFLFNALNSISSLIRTGDRDTALDALAGVGDLLRDVLAAETTPWRPLAEEVGSIERYLEIQGLRFGDRLQPEIRIAAETAKIEVPRLVLQPIVENAVIHGIGPSRRGGIVGLTTSPLEGGGVRIEVDSPLTEPIATEDHGDDGRPSNCHGTGLGNLRARLDRIYGGRARLDAGPQGHDGPPRQWRVVLHLPPRPEAI